jgi:hypothetical protein
MIYNKRFHHHIIRFLKACQPTLDKLTRYVKHFTVLLYIAHQGISADGDPFEGSLPQLILMYSYEIKNGLDGFYSS